MCSLLALHRRHAHLAVAALLALAILGCAGGPTTGGGTTAPTPTPTFTPTPTPTFTPTTGPQPSYLHAVSTPPGATVEINLKLVNGVVTPGTGRFVGTTPLTVQLMASDVGTTNGEAHLDGDMQLSGYYLHVFVITLGPGGSLQPGRTYEESVTMNPIR